MQTITTWQEVLKDTEALPALTENNACDVCIIGGGIVGITTAYYLAKARKKVIVVDKGTLMESVSAFTTAFLTSTIDTDLTDLQKMYGRAGMRKILESHEAAIDEIEHIMKTCHIDCEFKRVSNYEVALSKKGMKQLEKDARLSNAVGREVTLVKQNAFPFKCCGATESVEQAKFHPMKYLLALRQKAIEQGAKFYEKSEAVDIRGKDIVTITLKNKTLVRAKHVVTATYNPFKQPWWYIFKKGMYISYVYEIEIPKETLKEALYEDDNNPYFYFRIDVGKGKNGGDRMIIGGADHRKEIPFRTSGFKVLDRYIQETLCIREYTITKRWTGPILEQTDGLAYIGCTKKNSPNRFVATAFSGNGMTYGALSGMIISDMILGNKNIYENLYRPYRGISMQDIFRKGRDYFGEFIHGMKQHAKRGKKK